MEIRTPFVHERRRWIERSGHYVPHAQQ